MSRVPLSAKQKCALQTLADFGPMSARGLGVRSDLLRNLERRGLVHCVNFHETPALEEYSITPDGRAALSAASPSGLGGQS